MKQDYSQVKGKLRSHEWFNNAHNMGMTAVYALASDKVQRALDGAEVRKVIVVPDRLVNLVA